MRDNDALKLSQELAALEDLTAALLGELGPALFTGGLSGQIPVPVVALHPRGKGRMTAWFSPQRWLDHGIGLRPEISLCAEALGSDQERLAGLLLHELVHYANWLDGVSDARDSYYHNRHYRDRCRRIGLVCEHGLDGYGWAYTRLSPTLRTLVRGMPPCGTGRLARVSGGGELEAATPPSGSDLTLRLTDAPHLGLVRVGALHANEESPTVHYLARQDQGTLRWCLGFAEVVVVVRPDHIECRVSTGSPLAATLRRAA